ncbi:MAG TPA: tetratricopeptide repeat protein [Rhizomicrobium sp.]
MTLQTLLHQAQALHRDGRLAEAEKLYRRVAKEAPPNAQLQHRLALLQFQQQQHGEALVSIDRALAIDPGASEALVLKGVLLAAAGRHEDALAPLDRALARDPNHPDALYNRAVALLRLGRAQQAVAAFDQLLTIAPGAVEAWVNRGVALQQSARAADAVASYDRALALAPSHLQAWINRGTALHAQGQFAKALESFDRAIALAPRQATGWVGRGGTLMGLRRFEEALESYDTALEIAPGDPVAAAQRGALLETMKLFGAAGTDKSELDLWQERAAYFQITQHFPEALDALDKALALDADNSAALTRKGAVLCEARRTDDGMATYRHHAEVTLRGKPVTEPGDLPHKQRHDAEQRDWLAAQGINDDGFRLEPGARVPGPAVNPANAEEIARLWAERDPPIVVIDNLLTPDALEGLRRFCRGSTMWRRPYKSGYLGAMPETGFACPLLAQIADELRDVFPSVIGDHGLRRTWGFKYDSSLSGIPMHADQAAVNVNFWIAPDDASLDRESGGLVVWDAKAPLDWNFARYNTDEAAIRAFLAEKHAKPIVVPHRANRAVIFDSDLFHETDKIVFRDGYENRRINVTMLYGRRAFFGG